MDTEQLKTFLVVKKTLNLSRAAEILNVTQPSVTARIQNLEKELECKLLDKKGRGIYLTKEGEIFTRYAEQILEFMSEAKESIRLHMEPSLRVGFAPFSKQFIMDVVNLFKSDHNIKVIINEGKGSKDLTNMVINKEIDLAIVRTLYPHPELTTKHICNDKLIFIFGTNHPLASIGEIGKEDLVGETLICCPDTPVWDRNWDKVLGINNLKRLEVEKLDKLKPMVIANWGTSLIPLLSIEPYERDLLCIKPFEILGEKYDHTEDEFSNIEVYAIYRTDSSNKEYIELFANYIKDEVEKSIIEFSV